MKLTVLLIALCLSVSVYAGKRLPVLKSKDSVIVLKKNAFVSKLWRGVGITATAFVLTCGSMIGCGEIDGDDYDYGDRVYFVRGGVAYAGMITQELDNDQYLVKVNGTNMQTTVDEDEISGVYDPDSDEYRLEGSGVVLAGNRDGVKYRHGVLKRFYDNEFVEIRITHETMHNDDLVELAEPYIIFVKEGASLQEGGFAFGDFL